MPITDIVLQNVTKIYRRHPVLDHISFTFCAGQAYCLSAPSGTGKTTLLRILMGFDAPEGGTVSGITGMRISPVFQEDRLLEDATAFQNLRFVMQKRCPDDVLLHKLSLLLPPECAARPVREFSGGMKRRLCILRALLSPADCYLMDEPFAGLDSASKSAAIALIREMTSGKTLILSTHDARDAEALHAIALQLGPGALLPLPPAFNR